MVYCEVPAKHEEEFNAWYNGEHFLNAYRSGGAQCGAIPSGGGWTEVPRLL